MKLNLIDFYKEIYNNPNYHSSTTYKSGNYSLSIKLLPNKEEIGASYEVLLEDTSYNTIIFKAYIEKHNLSLLFKIVESCYNLII